MKRTASARRIRRFTLALFSAFAACACGSAVHTVPFVHTPPALPVVVDNATALGEGRVGSRKTPPTVRGLTAAGTADETW